MHIQTKLPLLPPPSLTPSLPQLEGLEVEVDARAPERHRVRTKAECLQQRIEQITLRLLAAAALPAPLPPEPMDQSSPQGQAPLLCSISFLPPSTTSTTPLPAAGIASAHTTRKRRTDALEGAYGAPPCMDLPPLVLWWELVTCVGVWLRARRRGSWARGGERCALERCGGDRRQRCEVATERPLGLCLVEMGVSASGRGGVVLDGGGYG
jgi:hypothetical protein